GRSERYGTPATAVVVSSVLVVGLALSGTFQSLVVLAVGPRVLVYASVALSAARLRARDGAGVVSAARFRMPAAPLMVGVVLAGCGGILATMTPMQGVALATGLAIGLLLYGGQAYQRRRSGA
ncbi:MAG: hypothetical protein ACK53I_14735, partial [Phenylobacterium sp.]